MQYAVVTGGAGALGSAITRLLIRDGVKVFVFDVDGERGEKLEEESDLIVFCKVDVTDASQLETIASYVIEEVGEIDYLVNTVANNPFKSFDELTIEEIDRSIQATLVSHAYAAKFFFEHIRRGGAIVNVSSVHSLATRENFAIYAAGNAGVDGLTRGLAIELRDRRVRVNSILPGAFASELLKEHNPDWREKVEKGQMFMPEDMAEIVCFLLKGGSKAINGASIAADGGVFAKRSPSSQF